jgi:hypothetical protein
VLRQEGEARQQEKRRQQQGSTEARHLYMTLQQIAARGQGGGNA